MRILGIASLGISLCGAAVMPSFATEPLAMKPEASLAVSGATATRTYRPSTENILNPERGFYMVGNDNGSIADLTTNYAAMRTAGCSLCYARVNLEPFLKSSITPAALDAISAGFKKMRAAGMKCHMRIVYNNGYTPDAPLERLVEHLKQLQPVFAANADMIAFVEMGIVGAWGENHSTHSFGPPGEPYKKFNTATPENRRAIVNALLTYLPPGKFIMLRRPSFKDPAFGKDVLFPGQKVDAASAFTSAPVARLGHHNDCFLANEIDAGTFSDEPSPSLEQQKEFLANDTLYVPIGGETCKINALFVNCENAQKELERLHYTFMNIGYNADVIRGWKERGCLETIAKRLGYRFELLSSEFPTTVTPGKPFTFSITVKNTGYAPIYNRRPIYLRLISAGKVVHQVELSNIDVRRWVPGKPFTVTGSATLPAGAKDPLSAALWLPDAAEQIRDRPEYAIQFANTDTWNEIAGQNTVATGITVGASPRKSAEPN